MGWFNEALRAVGFKPEASPYTYPQTNLAQADYDFKPISPKYSIDIEKVARAYATGNMSLLTSLIGKRSGVISFMVDLAWSGTVNTEPDWGKLIKSCGVQQTAHGSTGISWRPSSFLTAVPAVIEAAETTDTANPSQIVVQLRGCTGTAKLVLDQVGNPVRIHFEFRGPIVKVYDRVTAIQASGYDAVAPDVVLGATISAFGETLDLDKMTLDFGNKVELLPDPAAPEGFKGSHISGRAPTLQVDPYLGLLSANDHWSRLINGTTGAFSMTVGSHITVSAPALQISSAYDPGVRGGAVTNNILFDLTKGSSGDDEWEILQGSKT